MPIGDPGKEQFRDAQVELRNLAVIAYLGQVMTLREEFLDNDEMGLRNGFDTATLNHLNLHLHNADRWRRRITHNPDDRDIKVLIEHARDIHRTLDDDLEDGQRPGGDEIQRGSGGIVPLPFALDGTNPNIPLISQLELRNPTAMVILGAIDRHIVQTTRVEDRLATYRITASTSLMLLGGLQEVHTMVNDFGGDDNRIHIAGGTRRAEEPRGPFAAANSKSELVGSGGGTGVA